MQRLKFLDFYIGTYRWRKVATLMVEDIQFQRKFLNVVFLYNLYEITD